MDVTLEQFSYANMIMLHERFAGKGQLLKVQNHEMRMLEYHLIQDVLGQRLDHIEARYPADWWQACKARWFPRWALRRWPVLERVVRLEAVALYPKIALPKEEHVLRFEASRRNVSKDDAES